MIPSPTHGSIEGVQRDPLRIPDAGTSQIRATFFGWLTAQELHDKSAVPRTLGTHRLRV